LQLNIFMMIIQQTLTAKLFRNIFFVGLFLMVNFVLAQPPDYEWKLVRPSNTGIPGEEVRNLAWAPDGKLWVAARWPFWGEAGIGVLDTQTEIWTGWNNWQNPIPSEFINDMEFDQEGNAWIATGNGLVKFDGTNWEIFNASNSPMDLSAIVNISIAPNGDVWINNSTGNSSGDAIWRFDGESEWEDFRVPDDLPWQSPWTDLASVYAAADGKIYVSNEILNGLAVYDGNTWTLHGGNLDRFDKLCGDGNGNVWMIGNPVGGGPAVYKFDGNSFLSHAFAEPQTVAVDAESGYVYAGNWFGEIVRTTNGGQSWETWQTGLNTVRNIAPRPGIDEIWVGTLGAVGQFQENGNWIEDFNTYNTGLADYFVDNDLVLTTDGNMWFASGFGGLSRFDGLKWRNWGARNAGSEEYPFGGNTPMYGVYQDANGTVWMAGNGVARWEPETNDFTGFWNWQNSPLGLEMNDFAEGPDGTFFAFADPGIFRFTGDNWEQDFGAQPYSGIFGVENDSDGNVWIAGWFDLHYWDGNEWTTVVETTDDVFFQAGGINCFSVDNNDIFWFGCAEGLLRWDGTDFTLFTMDNSPLPANNIRGIDIREDGLIGISAADNNPQSGIALLNGDPENEENWTVFHYGESPQPHWQIENAQFDANGDLWISAISMGIAVLRTGNADLEVVSTTPEDQATDVNPTDTIVVTFNQEIAAYDLSGISITPDPGNISSSTEGNNLLITHETLDWNTGYTVHIPAFSVTNGWLPFEDDILWSFTTSLPTSVDEKTDFRFVVYPNPAANMIHLSNPFNSSGTYMIADLQGRVFQKGDFSGSKIEIDISAVAPGLYIFSTVSEQKAEAQKLIIK
jgi:hypothetical protein